MEIRNYQRSKGTRKRISTNVIHAILLQLPKFKQTRLNYQVKQSKNNENNNRLAQFKAQGVY
jgi:hypothetical protein